MIPLVALTWWRPLINMNPPTTTGYILTGLVILMVIRLALWFSKNWAHKQNDRDWKRMERDQRLREMHEREWRE